jgi:cyclopropane-fatty-acyl-phospholipid synthase
MLPEAIRNCLKQILAIVPLRICLNFWDRDRITNFGSWPTAKASADLTFTIHHPGVVRSLFLNRDVMVIPDSYLTGLIDVEGSLEQLLPVVQRCSAPVLSFWQLVQTAIAAFCLPPLPGTVSIQTPWKWLKAHTRDRDKLTVQHHYDLGNDFYRIWLDPHMVYSCAYFVHEQMSINKAQEAKLDLICRKLKLSPGETLLDIGCGWGALLRWAVEHYGVNGYGITLSQEQLEYNQKINSEYGLSDRIQVDFLDYRELPSAPTFDKIVSVGMVEHVGYANYGTYFQRILNCLKPGGLFLNHCITAACQWNGSSLGEKFINRYIFPDGELVMLSKMLEVAERAGWEIVDVDAWRWHYMMTLQAWVNNLDAAAGQITARLGERKFQIWRLYLLGCARAFENNYQGIYQTVLRRQEDTAWNLPLTRQHWLCFDDSWLTKSSKATV